MPLQICGRTQDGDSVVRGVFPLFSSLTGLPLENILEILHDNHMIVDWFDFYDHALKEGWKPERAINKIRNSLGEVYSPEYGKEVIKKFFRCKKRFDKFLIFEL